jgi:hypothetical protein
MRRKTLIRERFKSPLHTINGCISLQVGDRVVASVEKSGRWEWDEYELFEVNEGGKHGIGGIFYGRRAD